MKLKGRCDGPFLTQVDTMVILSPSVTMSIESQFFNTLQACETLKYVFPFPCESVIVSYRLLILACLFCNFRAIVVPKTR